MKRTWTIIGVADVAGSFKWYQSLFGQAPTSPAHDYFGQILDSDGTVLLCLHGWGAHDHPSLMSPDGGSPGNGLLLFFRVDDFDMALPRARALVKELLRPDRRFYVTGDQVSQLPGWQEGAMMSAEHVVKQITRQLPLTLEGLETVEAPDTRSLVEGGY